MRRWAGLGIAVGLMGCRPHAALSPDPPQQVLGAPYSQARRILLSQGYKTAQFGPSDVLRRRSEICDDLQGLNCRTYGETWNCRQQGDCEFDFVRAADHRVLKLQTQGDLPPSVGDIRWAAPDEIAQRNIINR